MANDLFMVAAAGYATGKLGLGLSMGYGRTASFLPANGTFTVECAVKNSAQSLEVFCSQDGAFWLAQDGGGNITAHYGSGGNEVTLGGAVLINDNTVHHVALVLSATGGKLFVDGLLVDSNAKTFAQAGGTLANKFGLRYFSLAGDNGGYYYSGIVDEVAVFDFAKYTAAFTPPAAAYANNTAGLLALYHFDNSPTDSAVAGGVVEPANTFAPNHAAILHSPANAKASATLVQSINLGYCGRTLFTGDTCRLGFNMANLTTSPAPRFEYRVDGRVWTTEEIAASVELVVDTNYTKSSVHLLEWFYATNTDYTQKWGQQQAAFPLSSITLATGGTLLKPQARALRGLVFSDSNGAGRMTLGNPANDIDGNSARLAWPAVLGPLLNAEIGAICFGGQGWTVGGNGGVPAFPAARNFYWSGEARPVVTGLDFLILAHGTNDPSGTDITAVATADVNALKAQYSEVPLFLVRPFNGNHAVQLQAVATATDTHYLDTTGWVSATDSPDGGLHFYGYAHETIAAKMAAAVQAVLNAGAGTPELPEVPTGILRPGLNQFRYVATAPALLANYPALSVVRRLASGSWLSGTPAALPFPQAITQFEPGFIYHVFNATTGPIALVGAQL
jgi:hypothetical protein